MVDFEGFLDKGLDAEVAECFFNIFGDITGNDNDGQGVALFAEELKEGHTVDGGHIEVEDEQAGVLILDGVDGFGPEGGRNGGVVVGLKDVFIDVHHIDFVIYDQDFAWFGGDHRVPRRERR